MMNQKLVAVADQLPGVSENAAQAPTGEKAGRLSNMSRWLVPLGALLVTCPTVAAPLTFDFNAVALSGSHTWLGATGGDTPIASYMNGVLATGGFANSSVSVSGALATKTYNGENHVIGRSLGTSERGLPTVGNDTFIINDNFFRGKDRFTLSFTNFKVYSLSFDWQIFPDANCPASNSPTSCARSNGTHANWPDLALLVGASTTPVWYAKAAVPASGVDPQGFGVSPTIYLDGAQTLVFRDWPAEIGIDNLIINGCAATTPNCLTNNVPEPSSLPLAGLAMFLGFVRYRMQGTKQASLARN